MKCLILAAGYATRLYPLTENFPKPLLKVGDKTILDWLLDDIDSSGLVDGYVVISNHKFADHFRQWADERAKRPAETAVPPEGHWPLRTDPQGAQTRSDKNACASITVVDDGTETNETRLGAVKDIQFAIDQLHIDDDVLVIAGDNVLDFSLCGFIEYGRARRTSCIMRYFEKDEARLHKCGVVEIDSHDRILSMEEKPSEPRSHWCAPPFYYYTRSDTRLIRQGILSGCGVDAPGSFVSWLSSQVPMHAMLMPGRRYDIGNLESYRKVCEEYKGITVK